MRIAYIYNSPMSFVRYDKIILRRIHDVRKIDFRFCIKDLVALVEMIKWADLVFCWFAARHAFFALATAKVFHKPSIVVTGGYDVANMPDINYGSIRLLPTRLMVRTIMQWAERVLPFSKASYDELLRNTQVNASKVKMLYIGVPSMNTSLGTDKENMALTTANVNWSNLKRKGLEYFVRSSEYLPEVPFVLVGRHEDKSADYLHSIALDNVTLTGFLSQEALNTLRRRAKVYVQASAHEGFGLALAEAMLWGCIPVVTERGSLPEVAGNIGVTVPYGDPKALAQSIGQAMCMNTDVSRHARQRILDAFPFSKRSEGLLRVVQEVFDESS